jgi:hypothetical protein
MAILAPLRGSRCLHSRVFSTQNTGSLHWIRRNCSSAGETMTVENSEQIEKIGLWINMAASSWHLMHSVHFYIIYKNDA